MYAELLRFDFRREQTLGLFLVYDSNDRVVFESKTLELDKDGNKEGESCIPASEYNFVPLTDRPESTTFNKESQGYFPYHITPVPGRVGILSHHGNFYTDILGCVLHGEEFYDINEDGLKDITNSRETMKELNKVVKETIPLTVKEFEIDRTRPETVYLS